MQSLNTPRIVHFIFLLCLSACAPQTTQAPDKLAPVASEPVVADNQFPMADLDKLQTGDAMRWYDKNILVYHAESEGSNGIGGEASREPLIVDEFWIDRYDITNEMYLSCVNAGACTPPMGEPDFQDGFDPALKDHPVTGVTWDQARGYCNWMDLRLPTQAEWGVAARSIVDPKIDSAVELKIDTTHGVMDDPQGQSSSGVFDMAGNVRNWTQDFFIADSFSPNPAESFKVEEGESVAFKVEEGEAFLVVIAAPANTETRTKVEEGEAIAYKVEEGEKAFFKVEEGEALVYKVEEGESRGFKIESGEVAAWKVEEGESTIFKVEEGEKRIIRGSGFKSSLELYDPDLVGFSPPGEYGDDLGFRCAIAGARFREIQPSQDIQDARLLPGFTPTCQVPANVAQIPPGPPACEPVDVIQQPFCSVSAFGVGGVSYTFLVGGDEIVSVTYDSDACFPSQSDDHLFIGNCYGSFDDVTQIKVCTACTPELESADYWTSCPGSWNGSCNDLPDAGPDCPQGWISDADSNRCLNVVPPPDYCPFGYEMDAADGCCYLATQLSQPTCWLGFSYDESSGMCVSNPDLYPPVIDCQGFDLTIGSCIDPQQQQQDGGDSGCSLTCKAPKVLDPKTCTCN